MAEPEKKYTQDDVDRMMAAKDKETSAKSAGQIEDLQKQLEDAKTTSYQDGLNEGMEKGEKRAQMSAEEKAKADLKDREDALTKREKDIADKEAREKRDAKVKDIQAKMAEKKLPKLFSDLAVTLVDQDDEAVAAKIDEYAKQNQELLDEHDKKKLEGKNNPASGNQHVDFSGMTQEKFDGLTMEQQMKLHQEQPDVYDQFAHTYF